MKAIWIILIVLVFVALAGLILATLVDWQPITDQTKGVISTVGDFVKNVPASLYAGIVGAFSAVVAIGKTVSNKINGYKSTVVKAQTEYQSLKTSTDKVMAEDVKVIQAKEEALKMAATDKEALNTQIKTVTDQKVIAETQVENTRKEMEVLYKTKAAFLQNQLPNGTETIDPETGTKIITLVRDVIK